MESSRLAKPTRGELLHVERKLRTVEYHENGPAQSWPVSSWLAWPISALVRVAWDAQGQRVASPNETQIAEA